MITWITSSNLGTVTANISVNIQLISESSLVNEPLLYSIINGALPSGLTISSSGLVTGVARQDALLSFDTNTTTFDQKTTSFDRRFVFTVQVRGLTSLDTSEQEFEIFVDSIIYKNIIVKAFLNKSQRELWSNFISNSSVFTPKYIYNFENSTYGVIQDLSMLVFAGIESTIAEKYISLFGSNFRKKQFRFGELAIASARRLGSRTVEYEVIYVKIYDPLEVDGKTLPSRIKINNSSALFTTDYNSEIFYTRDRELLSTPMPAFSRINPKIRADTTEHFASDSSISSYSPSSIGIWRQQILAWRENSDIDQENDGFLVERNYLPLWMRTIQFQENQIQEQGYTPAIVLCYCIPGTAKKIKSNIESYMTETKFSFNQLDFTVDRAIIDSYFFFK